MSSSMHELIEIKGDLKEKFKMKDLGKIGNFLGIDFSHHDNGTISMNQTNYLKRLLMRFGMQDCKPKYTPCDPNVNKLDFSESSEEIDATSYREIVGGLIYAMLGTRPDLSFIVTKLSQYMSKPNTIHMTLAKHTLRYVKATLDRKLIFRQSDKPLTLTGFCDSDWANAGDRKSISGYGFQFNEEGPLIAWKSKKQSTVALSTCEAEYISLASAAQEGIFLLSLLKDMTCMNLGKFQLNCDNQAAISLAKNPVQSQRTKHVDIKYHFVRNLVQDGILQIMYIPSDNNVADALTKPLSRIKNEQFKSAAMG